MQALVVALVTLVSVTAARADDSIDMEKRWPAVPGSGGPSMGDQIEDWITRMGGSVDERLSLLSHNAIALSVDGHGQRAHLSIHASTHYMAVGIDNDMQVANGVARFRTNINLRIGGRDIHVRIPDVEMAPGDYQGQRYVELRMPLWVHHW